MVIMLMSKFNFKELPCWEFTRFTFEAFWILPWCWGMLLIFIFNYVDYFSLFLSFRYYHRSSFYLYHIAWTEYYLFPVRLLIKRNTIDANKPRVVESSNMIWILKHDHGRVGWSFGMDKLFHPMWPRRSPISWRNYSIHTLTPKAISCGHHNTANVYCVIP